MLFLIDENLPASIGKIFEGFGHEVKVVADDPTLRGQSDPVIFEYAKHVQAVVVTRDVGFAHLVRFPLDQIPGIILLRFPHHLLISTLIKEVERLIINLSEEDFHKLVIIEPGIIRTRPIH